MRTCIRTSTCRTVRKSGRTGVAEPRLRHWCCLQRFCAPRRFAQCGRSPCPQKQLSEQRFGHDAAFCHAGVRRYYHFFRWLQQKFVLQFASLHQCRKGFLISFEGEEQLALASPLRLFCLRQGELLQRSGSCELRCRWLVQVCQTCSLLVDSILHCATVRSAEDVQTPSVFVSHLLVRVAALPLPLFSRPRDFVP